MGADIGPEKLEFAWLPRQLYWYDGKYLQLLRVAWLEWVRPINTVWHGKIYFEPRESR